MIIYMKKPENTVEVQARGVMDMNQIKNVLYKITCGILIFFFGCVFLQTTVNTTYLERISILLTGAWKPLFFVSGAVLLLFFLLGLLKLLNSLSPKRKNIVLLFFCCIGIALQLTLLLVVRPCLQHDALKPVDTAMSMLHGVPLASSQFYDYFSIYPHNLPLTLYILCIFKIARIFSIPEANYMILLQIINLLLLDFALISLYHLLNKRAGKKAALSYALLCLFNPLLYYYPVFFYTQVLSIPIFVLLITLFFQILDAADTKRRIFYGICYGIVLFLGWKIRFLTLITLIACAMYLFFHKLRSPFSKKALAVTLLSILLAFTGCLFIHNALTDHYELTTESEKAFPFHHWIMMGLQGDGSFYYMDEDFTKAIPTKEERITANTEVIKERLETLHFSGLIRLWGRKLFNTWSDGCDDYASNLVIVRHYSGLNDWLSGYRLEIPVIYLHLYNCMVWLLLTLCAFHLFLRKLPDFAYAICITILGGMMFHLLWEAGEQYSMPFALLITAGAAMGLDSFSLPSIQSRFTKKRKHLLGIAAGTVMGICVIHLIPAFVQISGEVTQVGAIQNLIAGDYFHLEEGQTLTQTVTCSRPFNTLTLRYKYYDDTEGDAVIRLRLLDQNGDCIAEEILPLENIIITENVSFPRIIPNGSEIYTIELTGVKIPQGSRGGFTAYNTGWWDVYPEGSACLNGVPLENRDLCFELTDHTEKTLF